MVAYRRGDTPYVVGVVSGGHFLSHLYLLAYPPLFPLLAREFEVTTAQLGLLVTAIYVPTLLLQLPLGEVVDRIGAKRVLVAGLVATSVGITLSGLATAYWTLLVLAFVSGVGQSVFHPANYALLDAVTATDQEGMAFSVHTFGGYAGFAAAPLVIGGIGVTVGWRTALLVGGSLGFGYAALVALTTRPVYRQSLVPGAVDGSTTGDGSAGIDSSAAGNGSAGIDGSTTDDGSAGIDESGDVDRLAAAGSSEVDDEPDVAGSSETPDRPEPGTDDLAASVARTVREMASYVRRGDMVLVFSFYLLSMMALVGLQSFTTVLAVDGFGLAESTANNILTVHLACTALGVILGGPVADHFPFRTVIVTMFVLAALGVWGIVLSAGGIVGIGTSDGVVLAGTVAAPGLFALFAVVGLLFGLALPSRDKFGNAVADPNAVGKSFGFYFTGLSLGAVVSPAVLGAVIDLWSAATAFLIVGCFLVAASAVVVLAIATRSGGG